MNNDIHNKIESVYIQVTGLTRGLKEICASLREAAAKDQDGPLTVVLCCLERIEDEIFNLVSSAEKSRAAR